MNLLNARIKFTFWVSSFLNLMLFDEGDSVIHLHFESHMLGITEEKRRGMFVVCFQFIGTGMWGQGTLMCSWQDKGPAQKSWCYHCCLLANRIEIKYVRVSPEAKDRKLWPISQLTGQAVGIHSHSKGPCFIPPLPDWMREIGMSLSPTSNVKNHSKSCSVTSCRKMYD